LKTPRKIFITTALVAALAAVVTHSPRHSNEPQFQGKPLTYWLLASTRIQDFEAAHEALAQIGTNALPFLLKRMQYESPHWRTRLQRTGPRPLQQLIYLALGDEDRLLAEASADAFKPIGPKAAVAIPELITLLSNTNTPQTAGRAMRALSHLGTNGLPPLISLINNPQSSYRFYAVATIAFNSQTPEEAELTTPMLLQCLTNTTDPQIPWIAAFGLGRSHYAPRLVVPALARCLTSASTPRTRAAAADALAQFSGQATAALPALTNALADPFEEVRWTATNAIHKITSGALTNAPAR
jgi:HEAT repeat protein